jgi:endonuclease YncB( thermonuclease family)
MAEVIPFRPRYRRPSKLWPRPFLVLRRYRWIIVGIAACAAIGFAIGPLQERRVPIVGFASIVDGDTIRIRGERIRLVGMDAPELHQTCRDASGRDWSCGSAARGRLAALVASSTVTCSPTGHDRYGRTLAVCTSSTGGDLGGTLVREGLAVAYFGLGYKMAEIGARLGGRGLWAGDFERPQQWRKAHKH